MALAIRYYKEEEKNCSWAGTRGMKPRRENCLSGSRRSQSFVLAFIYSHVSLLSHSTHLTEDLLDGRWLSSPEFGVK